MGNERQALDQYLFLRDWRPRWPWMAAALFALALVLAAWQADPMVGAAATGVVLAGLVVGLAVTARSQARLVRVMGEQMARQKKELEESLGREQASLQRLAEIGPSEERFRAFYEQAPLSYQSLDADARLVTVNAAWLEMLGYSRDQVIGHAFAEFMTPESAERVRQSYPQFKAAGLIRGAEFEMIRRDGTLLTVTLNGQTARDAQGQFKEMHGVLSDITEQKRAERELRQANRALTVLGLCRKVLVRATNERELLQDVCRLLVEVGNYRLAWVGLAENDPEQTVRPVAAAGQADGYVDALHITWADGERGRGPTGTAVRTGQVVIVRNIQTDPAYAPWRAEAIKRGFGSSIALPLRPNDHSLGALSIYAAEPDAFDGDIRLLKNLSDDLAYGLEALHVRAQHGQAEAALRASEERYRAVSEMTSDYVYALSIGADGKPALEWMSDAFLRITGYTAAEFSEMDDPADMIYPQDRPIYQEHFKRLLNGEPVVTEVRAVRKNGEVYWVRNYSRPLRDLEHGRVIRILGATQDITAHKETEEQIHRRASEFSALYETMRDLTTQHDVPTLLQTIVDRAMTLLDAPNGAVYLYDAAHTDLELVVSRAFPQSVGTRFQLGEGVSGWVAQTRQPALVDDYRTWERDVTGLGGTRITAVAAVPMLYGGELIGVLGVTEIDNTVHRFKQADLRLLTLFAAQAASAVHNARLFQETNQRAEQLALLYDAGLALNRVLDPRQQMELLFGIAVKALRADRVTFFRYDAVHERLEFQVGVGHPPEIGPAMHRVRYPLGEERGLVGWVSQQRTPLYLPDVTADPRFVAVDPAVRSGLWVPVEHENQRRGVLSVMSLRVDGFTPADERLLVLFANQLAVALENARLFDETKRRARHQQALNTVITEAAKESVHIDQFLDAALEQALAALGLEQGAIWMMEPGRPRRIATRGLDAEIGEAIARVYNSEKMSFTETMVETDSHQSDHPLSRLLAAHGMRASLSVPLMSEGRQAGGLGLLVDRPRSWSEEEIAFIESIAHELGTALDRIRLFEETHQRLAELEAVYKISASLRTAQTLEAMLPVFLDEALAALGSSAGLVAFLDVPSGELRVSAARGWFTVAARSIRPGEGIAGRVFLSGQPHISPDLRVDPWTHGASRPDVPAGWSGACVPLRVADKTSGVLFVAVPRPAELTEKDAHLMATIAEIAGNAVHRMELHESLEDAYDTTLEGWSRALDLRDKETEGHTLRVTEITLKLARAAGISEEALIHVRRGALLHDIGKVGIPDNILLKPGPLTTDEWVTMRLHPVFAHDLLAPIEYLRPALDIPFCHHEKWDGTGYPRGLKGAEIPLAARIFAVVDVWDALRSDRPYRPAWPEAQVLAHIRAGSGNHFDPKVVELFLALVPGEGPATA